MKDNKNIIIGLLVFIIVLLIIVIGLISYDKISFHNDNNLDSNVQDEETNEENLENDVQVEDYQFGEEIILSNLSNVTDWSVEVQDFSKWNVLSDDGDYVTLYSSSIWSKVSDVSDASNINSELFSKYQIDLGSNGLVRGLNESDLKLLGCDINTLVCNNTPDWAGYSLTSVKINNSNVVFYGKIDFTEDVNYKLELMEVDDALVYFRPVIKILKSSIE